MQSLRSALLFLTLFTSSLFSEKIKVVATFLPMFAHTQSITGDLAEVYSLIGPGSEPHHFQFKPSEARRLSEAQLIVMNGAGIEDWLEKPLSQLKLPSTRIVNASEGIDLISLTPATPTPLSPSLEPKANDQKYTSNPHTWLDPLNAKIQVQNILQGLIQADPKNRLEYEKNAAHYLGQLDQLHQAFKDQVEVLKNKNLMTLHDSFPYLARRYGFQSIGYVADLPEKNPSPRALKKLIDQLNLNHVGTIFVEEGYSIRTLQAISQATGCKIASLDPLEIGAPSADAYLKQMQKNLEVLKKAWSNN